MAEANVQREREEMQKERIPLVYRDYCAHLLVPLNKCRIESFYLPWKCTEERHEYERCQYVEYQNRLKEKIQTKGSLH